jgi:hypothetical protein
MPESTSPEEGQPEDSEDDSELFHPEDQNTGLPDLHPLLPTTQPPVGLSVGPPSDQAAGVQAPALSDEAGSVTGPGGPEVAAGSAVSATPADVESADTAAALPGSGPLSPDSSALSEDQISGIIQFSV